MTQQPHEAHGAQPVTTEEETYNPTTATVQEQGLADKQVGTHKQVMSPSLQEAGDDHKKEERQGALTVGHRLTAAHEEAVARSGRGTAMPDEPAGASPRPKGWIRSAKAQPGKNGETAHVDETASDNEPRAWTENQAAASSSSGTRRIQLASEDGTSPTMQSLWPLDRGGGMSLLGRRRRSSLCQKRRRKKSW